MAAILLMSFNNAAIKVELWDRLIQGSNPAHAERSP